MTSICPVSGLTCDFCDYQELEKLSHVLHDSFVEGSLRKHPRYVNFSKMNEYKISFYDALDLRNPHSKRVYDFEWVQNACRAFCEACRSSMASISNAMLGAGDVTEAYRTRYSLVPCACSHVSSALTATTAIAFTTHSIPATYLSH